MRILCILMSTQRFLGGASKNLDYFIVDEFSVLSVLSVVNLLTKLKSKGRE